MLSLYQLFRLCMEARYLDAENGASVAVLTRDSTLHILFQHSYGEEDWKNNLDFPAVPYRDMEEDWRCHRGFLRVWRSAEPYIAEILAQTTFERITVAGYSHGGALAVLCHEYIWFHHPDKRAHLRGVGFGAPRVIWCQSGCRRIAPRWENFTVVRNREDVITYLPPLLFGYRHMGQLLPIGKKGRYSSFNAHRPENYLASLAEREGITDTSPQSPV